MTHIKVDGFGSAGAAIAAVDAGADSIGLVFVPTARRCLSLDAAEALLGEVRVHAEGRMPPARMPEVVGLFADQPEDDVNRYVERLGLNAVQLCGAEGMGYAKAMTVPIYKVIAIDPEVPIGAQMPKIMVLQQRHTMAGHRIVVDTLVAGEYGGTGQRFDWTLAGELARAFEMTLAGGLTPENVGEAVRSVRPWGVDTSSGVETDGEKDVEKVRAFVRAVREADEASAPRGLRRLLSPRWLLGRR